jgi:phenylalanyl-tRNA synthetase alpha chain
MENLNNILEEALTEVNKASSFALLNDIKVEYLGKKGKLTLLLRNLGALSKEERPKAGQLINESKQKLTIAINNKQQQLEQIVLQQKLTSETIDVTLEGNGQDLGALHPITQTTAKICGMFQSLGFKVESGPEIEDNYHNFEALNIPKHHPARAMHDTFYLDANYLLRTHTSPVQIRTLKQWATSGEESLAIICPGKVYRCDHDQTHSPMFHQIEGLFVAKQTSFAELKSLLTEFIRNFFVSNELKIRFRPSYFPFTEPSAEVDIEWGNNPDGSTKWLEVLGCGMVHPQVLANVGIDTEIYSGFAFGLGVERFCMLQHGINDLRQFYDNDIRFLAQFK